MSRVLSMLRLTEISLPHLLIGIGDIGGTIR